MADARQLTGEFDRCFEGLEDKARECAGKYNAAVDHINDWRFVLGPVLVAVGPALNGIRKHLETVFKLIRTAVEHHVPVVSLIIKSFDWLNRVQAPVNGLVLPKTHLTYHWQGVAGTAYQDKLTAQNEAIAATAVKADQVSKWLMDIAKYNVEYMVELSKMATGFLGALVTVALETVTVVEIPFAADKLATAIGTLVTQSLDNLTGIAKRFVEALGKVRDLLSLMTDPKLPGRKWPQAVTG